MDKYEINVWKDAELLSKEILDFDSNEECYKNGVTLNRPPLGIRITWSKLGHNQYKPKRLSAEDRKMQRDLYDSITPETIRELGPNEMYAKVRRDYGPNPNAKGYDEFPGRKKKVYINGSTGKKYTV